MEILKNKKMMKLFKILMIIVIISLLVLGIKGFMGSFSFSILAEGLNKISPIGFITIIIMGLVAFIPMCFYDYLIKRKLNLKISNKDIFKFGFIVNAVTIVAGFGDAAGIGLRGYFYKNEAIDKKQLLIEVSRISFLNPTGLSLLSIIYLIFYSKGEFIFSFNGIVALLIALYLPGILIYNFIKHKERKVKEYNHIISVIISSFFDWGLSTLLFFIILKILGLQITFNEFFPVYVIAMILGIISMLPGAVGTFDLSMLIGLTTVGVSKELALLSIFLYRIAYYIIPLLIAGIIYFTGAWKESNKKFKTAVTIAASKVSFLGLRILIFISGVALLLINAIPRFLDRFREIEFLSYATEMHFAKVLVIIVGFLLIVMAIMLKYRAKTIYYLTIFFLIIGTIFTLIKSFNYIAVGYLILVAIILAFSKKEFYRKSFVVGVETLITSIIIVFAFWILYIITAYLSIPFKAHLIPKIFEMLTHRYRNLISFSTIGFILALVLIITFYLLGKYRNKIKHNLVVDNLEKVEGFLKKYNGTSLTHLIFLKDKYLYFSENYEGMIQYGVYSNKLIVLGNPLGKIDELKGFIEEFYDFADSYGYTPIFFEVSGDMLEILHEFGYEFMKLGEAAIVDVEEFTIAGQKMQKVRTCCNKINREGYSFEVIEGPYSELLLKELKVVSDKWLLGKKEMGFSMGFFDEDYINKGPLGIVRDKDGILQAFVTIMPTYGENKKFCSDLMRFSRETPRGVMDYMFVKLLEWGKENNYKYFDFGVAPLSNVGSSKYSFLSERLAYQLYYYGQRFYSFEGLKKFKAKYAHNWEPKFLAYKNKFNLPITALQSNLIVSSGVKGRNIIKK